MTTRTGWVLLFALAGWAAPGRCADRDAIAAYRFTRPIVIPDRESEEIVVVELDGDVYAETRDGFPDLRVIDDTEEEIPFVIDKAVREITSTIRVPVPVRIVSLDERPENRVVITVNVDSNAPPVDGFRIRTPLKDFERRLRVSGREESGAWATRVDDALVFDYTRFVDLSHTEVAIPRSRDREFRIEIEDVTDEQFSSLSDLARTLVGGLETEVVDRTTVRRRPFRIDGIEGWTEAEKTSRRRDVLKAYDLAILDVEEESESQETHLRVAAQREPLRSMTLQTRSRNFSRRVSIRVPAHAAGGTTWREIGNATLSRIRFRDVNREALTIVIPETRAEEYMVVIENKDSPPLEPTGLVASGTVCRVGFFASPGQTLHLRYGSEEAQTPSYDLPTVLSALDGDYGVVAGTLGAQSETPGYHRPATPGWKELLNSRPFFGVVVAVVSLTLLWMLFAMGKKAGSIPDEDP